MIKIKRERKRNESSKIFYYIERKRVMSDSRQRERKIKKKIQTRIAKE